MEGVGPVETRGLARRLLFGTLAIALLVVFTCGFAASVPISGAVIAAGVVALEGHVKTVQHSDGGIVARLFVSNGDFVEQGHVLIKLDETQLRSQLGVVRSQLLQLYGRQARLVAQSDPGAALEFPDKLFADADGRAIVNGETRLYRSLLSSLTGRRSQLEERIKQLAEEVRGLRAQLEAKSRELELVKHEVQRVDALYQRKLLPVTRALAAKRDRARIAGEHGALRARIASVNGQINETRLQILSLEEEARTRAQSDLRDVDAKISELDERRVAAQDALERMEIRAPAAGIVHDLKVHTVGGVITKAEPLMTIVPSHDGLVVDAVVARHDIDQVRVGQHVKLRFPALNHRTVASVDGSVVKLSPATRTDQRTGVPHFVARVAPSPEALRLLGDMRVLPGTNVDVFIETEARTVLAYLLEPITDNWNRALRER